MKEFLMILGSIQVTVIILAFSIALGRATVINNWKLVDLFWFKKIENLFVKLLTRRKKIRSKIEEDFYKEQFGVNEELNN